MASQETLLDLSNLIKSIGKKKKGVYINNKQSKFNIDKQKKVIKNLEKRNSQINYQRKKLKQEQVSKGVSKERVKKIDLILNQLQTVPLGSEKNYLRMIEGKDFNFIIDTGFKRSKIKLSKILKEKNPSLKYAKELEREIKGNIDQLEKKLKRKGLSKVEKKILNKKVHVLNKLLVAAEYNTRVSEGGDNTQEDGEYPMLVLIVGESIRINA